MRVHKPQDAGGRARPVATHNTNSDQVNHTVCRLVRAPAQGRQREEQANPPEKENTERGKPQPSRAHLPASGTEGKRGAESHNSEAPHRVQQGGQPPSQATPKAPPTGPADRTRGNHPAQPEDAQREKGGPPRPHSRRRARGKDTPDKLVHTLSREVAGPRRHGHGHSKKKKTQPKGTRGAGSKGVKVRTGDGDHHRTTTPQSREPHPQTHPLAPKKAGKKNKKSRGWRNPAHSDPHKTPHCRRPHPRVAGYERRACKRAGCHETRGAGKTQTQTHRPQTPAKFGGAKPKPVPKHTHPRPQPGMAGLPRNPNANTRTTNPSQEWRGEAKTRTKNTQPRTHPGMAGLTRNPDRNTSTTLR